MPLPPCDHDECTPTRCLRVALIGPAARKRVKRMRQAIKAQEAGDPVKDMDYYEDEMIDDIKDLLAILDEHLPGWATPAKRITPKGN